MHFRSSAKHKQSALRTSPRRDENLALLPFSPIAFVVADCGQLCTWNRALLHIHCNLRGFAMLAVVFLIAIGTCSAVRYAGDGPPMMVAALLILVDVVYR
jgi:hypothetical protein